MAKQRGFTLIELLVAITILAVVAVLGWRGLDSIVRSRIALTGEMEQTRGMQLAFAQLQSDCEHMTASSSIGGRKTLAADPTRLSLVRTVYADNQPSRLAVVTYRLIDGVLERRESAATRDLLVLDALWRSALEGTEMAQPVTLHSGIGGMAIQQWQSNGPGWKPVDSGTVSAADAMAAARAAGETPGGAQPGGAQPGPVAPIPTGLQVTFVLQGQERGLTKVFLLGAV
ncbi:MAG TPA: prepilin-type N-terminal cleavage/methylation domain-containing protein [Burkholderiaceae bacterium]